MRRSALARLCLLTSLFLLGGEVTAYACPPDNGPAPANVKNNICGAWNAFGDSQLGGPLNDAHRWASGWTRDFAGGSFGRGALMLSDEDPGWVNGVAGPYWQAYLEVGGATGPLGYPVGRHILSGNFYDGNNNDRYATFRGGNIDRWAGGTFAVYGGIFAKWGELGYGASALGRPTGIEGQSARVDGRYQRFENGEIIYNPRVNGAFLIYGGILNKYAQLGYSNHPLGLPTSDRRTNPVTGNEYQLFDGGVITQYGGQAYETHGAIFGKWNALGNATGPVGLPTSDEQDTARVPGRYATFQGGNLIWDQATGNTYFVSGGILAKYAALGYSGGFLGLPTSDRQRNDAKGVDYQTFQGGVINEYGGRSFALGGAILASWDARGGANGPIGLPTSDEIDTPRVPGRYQEFQGGSLIWNRATGVTYLVYGGILNKYRQFGGSSGSLGLPTSDRKRNDKLNVEYQTFQGGVIDQYNGNAYGLRGAILERWNQGGGAEGPLGLPTSDELAALRSPQGTSGRYQRFQRGYIDYNPKINKAIVLFGAISAKYAALGFSGSYLGLPTSEEFNASGGKRQNFEGGYLLYTPTSGARTDRELSGKPNRRLRFRAIGDSVTAGFGYDYRGWEVTGSPLTGQMAGCIKNTTSRYCQSPRVVSYPAFFAQKRQLTDWQNFAQSGSTLEEWLSRKGKWRPALDRVVADNPDLTALTLGANPILDYFVDPRNVGGLTCARKPDSEQCIRRELDKYATRESLNGVIRALLKAPSNHVVVFLYQDTVPLTLSGANVRLLLNSLNTYISEAVTQVLRDPKAKARGRLKLVGPGPFAAHHCDASEPWILLADSCIHPNSLGYQQFALALDRAASQFGLFG